jgi:hypothetical protein
MMKKSTIFVGILGAILAIAAVSTSAVAFAQSMGSGDTGGMTGGDPTSGNTTSGNTTSGNTTSGNMTSGSTPTTP